MKHYIVLNTRGRSIHGEHICLFWGYGEKESGYTSDPYMAHRYNENEISSFWNDSEDIPLDISKLGLKVEYTETNKNVLSLIEKGTINRIYKLGLRG